MPSSQFCEAGGGDAELVGRQPLLVREGPRLLLPGGSVVQLGAGRPTPGHLGWAEASDKTLLVPQP